MPLSALFDYLEALLETMEEKLQTKLPSRHTRLVGVIFGFANVSARRLGSIIQKKRIFDTRARVGALKAREEEEESSNWREFAIVSDATEDEGSRGRL